MRKYLVWCLNMGANMVFGGRRGEIWLVRIRIAWRKWRGLPVMMAFWTKTTPMEHPRDGFEEAFGGALNRRIAADVEEFGIRSDVPVDTFAEPRT